jgi:hypothetical protein
MMTISRDGLVRRVLSTTLMISSLSLALSSEVRAEYESAPQDAREAETVLYVEGTSMILLSGLVVNLEHSLTRSFSLSAGAGISSRINLFGSNDSAFGPRVQVHYFYGGGNRMLELAAGVCFCNPFPAPKEDLMFYLGYRNQPVDGGFTFRAGVAYAHVHAMGPSLSFGHSF